MASLNLTFDNITSADVLVGDASVVGDWNTFFDLPTYGTPFSAVTLSGNTVQLFGGSNIEVKIELFAENNSLTEVYDTGSIITLGESCFGACSLLSSVYFGACTTTIYTGENLDYGTFGSCYNLTSATFPVITEFADYVFYDCNTLTTIDFPNLTIANVGVFEFCAFSSINLPNLTTAGASCFYSCSSLTTINLPNLTTASGSCFTSCSSLTTINLPNLTTAGGYCFNSCSSLTTIDLPSLTTAGVFCFYGCTSITTINLPNLVSIGTFSFGEITSLTTINIPSCTDLGGTVGDNNVFNGITGNTITLTVPRVLMTCDSGSPDGDIQYLQANNTVTVNVIDPNALNLVFDSIANADSLVGDASVVGDWNTFFDLPTYGTPFSAVTLSGNTVQLFGGSGITIKENTFINNTHILTVIDDLGCVTSIYTDSFSYCVNITQISFPECLDITGGGYFDGGAFYGLHSLTSMYFPKLNAINNQCFGDCISLTTINLPSLTYAGVDSFYYCTSLTSINLPSLTATGEYCFSYCTSLTTIDFSGLTTAGDNCFQGCLSLTTFNLPNLTTAGNNCFDGCTSLTTVNLPNLITAGQSCFLGCTSLTTIDFSGLTSALNGCFYQCTSLTTINLPSLKTAANSCFYGCTSLTTINLPSLIIADEDCFRSCTSLTTINLPSLVNAGIGCFYLCTSLTTIYLPKIIQLGSDATNNNVFYGISSNTIDLTVNKVVMVNNSGGPDLDIVALQSANTVTITEVISPQTITMTADTNYGDIVNIQLSNLIDGYIDWGDGNIINNVIEGDFNNHTYSSNGKYQITVTAFTATIVYINYDFNYPSYRNIEQIEFLNCGAMSVVFNYNPKSLYGIDLNPIDFSSIPFISTIVISNAGLLGFSPPIGASAINLSINNLTELNLSTLPNLSYLNLSSNNLSSLILMNDPSGIPTLDVRNNYLTSLVNYYMTSILECNISLNNIESIDIGPLYISNQFFLSLNNLPSTQIDNLLHQLVENNLSGGAKIFITNQSTGTTLSAQGLLDKSTLESNGNQIDISDVGLGQPGTLVNNKLQRQIIKYTDGAFIFQSLELPNGKILFGGQPASQGSHSIFRLDENYDLDNNFNVGPGFNIEGTTPQVRALIYDSDNKVVVGGEFTEFSGQSYNRIIRLNEDGSADTTFNVGTGFDARVRVIRKLSSGKFLVGGDFDTYDGENYSSLIRLNSDGSIDNTFVIGSGFTKPNTSGVYEIVEQPDGKLLIGGWFTEYSGVSANRIIRLNSDGTIDNTFNYGTGFNERVNRIGLQPNGKMIVIGGNYNNGGFTEYNGTPANSIIRLNSDGTVDPTFNYGTGFNGYTISLILQSDGKIIITGYFDEYNGNPYNSLIRLNSDGTVDESFYVGTGLYNPISLYYDQGNYLYQYSNGQIFVFTWSEYYDGAKLYNNNFLIEGDPTPTPTPSPTGSIVTTPTPTPTKTSSPTPSVTPTNTPSPTFIPYSGVAANDFYAYTIEILGDFSGGTAPTGAIAPHPIMIGNDGIPYAQMNAIQIGGFGGLNN